MGQRPDQILNKSEILNESKNELARNLENQGLENRDLENQGLASLETPLAVVFPGQGSQSIRMLSEWAEDSVVQNTFVEASDNLGYDLWDVTQNGPEEKLNQSEITQPALLTAGVALWRVWQKNHGERLSRKPLLLAGHSLGEYTALVCANALDLSDGVKLVRERGQRMQAAVANVSTAMAAILGLNTQQVVELCAKTTAELKAAADLKTGAEAEYIVEAANFNSEVQIVIAGHERAVLAAIEGAKAMGAKRAIRLAVSVPSHTSLMKPAAQGLSASLEKISFRQPEIAVLQNVDVSVHASVEGIRHALVNQLFHPVRWLETTVKMAGIGIKTIVECGPGTVLTGLNKRNAAGVNCMAVTDETFRKYYESITNR